jgi:hypothetical protein
MYMINNNIYITIIMAGTIKINYARRPLVASLSTLAAVVILHASEILYIIISANIITNNNTTTLS